MYDGTSAMTFNPPITAPQRRPVIPAERAPVRPAATTGQTQRQASARRAAATAPSMRLKPGTVLLFAGAMAVLLFIVYSYMQLSELSSVNQQGLKALQTLIKEEAFLNHQIEASVSLSEVAAYAEAELGMIKPTREQIVYIGTVAQDHAEIIPQQGFWGAFRQLFSTMTTSAAEFFD